MEGIEQIIEAARRLDGPLSDPSIEPEHFVSGVHAYTRAVSAKKKVQSSLGRLLVAAKYLPIGLLIMIVASPPLGAHAVGLVELPEWVSTTCQITLVAGGTLALCAFIAVHVFESRLSDAVVTSDWNA